MRRDMVDLVKKAIPEKWMAYVVVNNRSEGHAPGTVKAIHDLLKETVADAL